MQYGEHTRIAYSKISRVPGRTTRMNPISLFESRESNGSMSLKDLFNNPAGFDGCHSDLDIDGIIYAICRGGWPHALMQTDRKNSLLVAKDLFQQICKVDISNVDGVNRSPVVTKSILCSYSRNICQNVDNRTIISEVNVNHALSESSYYAYLRALKRLNIVSDLDAWCPAIRPKTAIKSGKKRNLVDPSIAVAALGIDPEYFNTDFKTLGFLFKSLCMRDLTIYLSKFGGSVSYYRDRYGLEADAVLHLDDGRYALCEIKLGQNDVDDGARHLVEMERLIEEYNRKETQMPLKPPTLKIVITGTEYGYRRDDGVLVIPLACLRN